MIVPRLLSRPIQDALEDTPAVLLTGARQTGKSTLAQQLVGRAGTYRTLDDTVTLAAALEDPVGFLDVRGPLVIDEIQRAPSLLVELKAAVDRDRRPGAFVLTGSSDVMTLPAVSESLAGRIETHRLRPLSMAELTGEPVSVIDRIASGDPPSSAGVASDRAALIEVLMRGGYPELLGRPTSRRQRSWMKEYVNAVVQREVPSVADVQFAEQLPRLLRLVAAGSPGMLNISGLTASLGLPRSTVDRYLSILRQVFLVDLLTPWHANSGTRPVKSLRQLLPDSGLLAYLLDLDAASLMDWYPDKIGPLLETFVGNELLAQAGWAQSSASIGWWRTGKGVEVDFVIERGGGMLDGVEVKAAATASAGDFRGLRALRDAMGDRFGRGILLYTGRDALSFGDRLEAWPLDALWGGRPLVPGDR